MSQNRRYSSLFLQKKKKNFKSIAFKDERDFPFFALTNFITIALLFEHPWSRRGSTKVVPMIRQGSSLF